MAPQVAPAIVRPRRSRRVAVQVVGFLLGLAMIGWCARVALREENRAQLERLLDASPWAVLGLVGLSVLTLAFNGLIFWFQILPVRRLPVADVVATNAVASLLNYLPFKLSLVSRLLIHKRRNGVPIMTIGAWLGAVAITFLGTVGVVVGAAIVAGGVNGLWWALTLGGVGVWIVVQVVGARVLAGPRGLARIHAVADRFGPGLVGRLMRTDAFRNAHAGMGMLAGPVGVAGGSLLRVGDIITLALRFVLAASVLGLVLDPGDAVVLAAGHFLIGVISPFGMLGTREAGTAGLVGLLTLAGGGTPAEAEAAAASFTVALLLVTAVEALVNLAVGGVSIAWLRPDRLIAPGGVAGPELSSTDAPGAGPDQPDGR